MHQIDTIDRLVLIRHNFIEISGIKDPTALHRSAQVPGARQRDKTGEEPICRLLNLNWYYDDRDRSKLGLGLLN
jgi:hypothetical protein